MRRSRENRPGPTARQERLNALLGRRGLWLPLALAFLFVSLSRIDDGGTAANARFATLRAMAVEHTFRIDHYFDWTDDWVRSPDSHYFSNKAPGPTLIAFPLFWVIDLALRPLQEKSRDSQGRAQAPRGIHKVAVSTAFQVLPFLLLSLLLLHRFAGDGSRPGAYLAAGFSLLFGNTAAVLMSSYFGNPFAAMAVLGFSYFYLSSRIAPAAFCFGWAVLSEYFAAALTLPFACLMVLEARRSGWKAVTARVAAGAALPMALWAWYHTACFGGPLSLPFAYEAPTVTLGEEGAGGKLWGFASLLPDPWRLYELVLGPTRGLLFTQPWLLLSLGLGIAYFRRREKSREKELFCFALAGLALLLWMNAGVTGWHGGGSPGPRYLSAVLPLFACFLIPLYEAASVSWRALIWLAVGASVALRSLVYATWLLAPPEPIWPYYLSAIRGSHEWLRIAAFWAAVGAALLVFHILQRGGRKSCFCARPGKERRTGSQEELP